MNIYEMSAVARWFLVGVTVLSLVVFFLLLFHFVGREFQENPRLAVMLYRFHRTLRTVRTITRSIAAKTPLLRHWARLPKHSTEAPTVRLQLPVAGGAK